MPQIAVMDRPVVKPMQPASIGQDQCLSLALPGQFLMAEQTAETSIVPASHQSTSLSLQSAAPVVVEYHAEQKRREEDRRRMAQRAREAAAARERAVYRCE